MQKKKEWTETTQTEVSEPEIDLEYEVQEEATTLARSGKNNLDKQRRGSEQGFVASLGNNPTMVGLYVLLIVLGLFIGRWLYARNQAGQEVAVPAATATSSEAVAAPSDAKTTSSGFVCPPPQQQLTPTAKELNMLVWTEYLPSDWFECFELTYGIKINRTEFSSNEEMLTLLAEKPDGFDLLQPSDQGVTTLIAQGSLKELDKAALPIINGFNPAFMNPPFDPGNKYSLPYQAGSIALAVNSAKINPLPTSWADLWKSEYAGRVMLMEDANDVIGMTLLTMGFPFNSTDPAHLEAIKPKLKEILKATKKLNSDSQSSDILSGEIDLGLFWNGEAALAQRENSDIQYIYPTEGAMLWQDNYVISAKTTHEDAAYAWINYTMQGDMFWMMLREFPYTNPNQAALEYAKSNQPELYQEYINSTVTNVPTQAMLNGHWLVDLGEGQALYDQLWAEVTATK